MAGQCSRFWLILRQFRRNWASNGDSAVIEPADHAETATIAEEWRSRAGFGPIAETKRRLPKPHRKAKTTLRPSKQCFVSSLQQLRLFTESGLNLLGEHGSISANLLR